MASRNNTVNRLRSKGADIAEDLRGLGNVFKDAASDKVSQIKSAASARASELREAASDKLDQLKENAASARDSVNGFVSTSPWKAIAIAAVSGIAAGFLLRRR